MVTKNERISTYSYGSVPLYYNILYIIPMYLSIADTFVYFVIILPYYIYSVRTFTGTSPLESKIKRTMLSLHLYIYNIRLTDGQRVYDIERTTSGNLVYREFQKSHNLRWKYMFSRLYIIIHSYNVCAFYKELETWQAREPILLW